MRFKKFLLIPFVLLLTIVVVASLYLFRGEKDNAPSQDLNASATSLLKVIFPNLTGDWRLRATEPPPPILTDPVDDDSSNRCLTMRSGNVKIEVNYPDFLYPKWYLDNETSERFVDHIFLYKRLEENDVEPILFINEAWSDYDSVENIVKYSLIERPGPIYEKSVFNGIPAAFNHTESDTYIWDLYEVPFSNRVISIKLDYKYLTESELIAAREMLRGITLTQVKESVKRANVTHCDN